MTAPGVLNIVYHVVLYNVEDPMLAPVNRFELDSGIISEIS